MKQESTPLISFIRDHGLEKPDGAVCFIADIQFRSQKKDLTFTSPVHVVTISVKHLDVIYLLNPEIDAAKINTMHSNSKRFSYNARKGFSIKGKSKYYGRYHILIVPISKDCGLETTTEINAKTHN